MPVHRLPLAVLVACAHFANPALGQAAGDWTAYGRDQLGSRYSPLTQITTRNVGGLTVAWTYRTGDTTIRRPPKFEATPLVLDGTMYLSTPYGRAIALDPATGREKWTYGVDMDRGGNWG